MSWTLRHEGSPRTVEGLTPAQVVVGLQEGQWEPTDEVRGPTDAAWIAIENHPQFAEVAAELEAPPPKFHPDESKLDMNPLIDVALVLLIFFILTTTYETIRKGLEMHGVSAENVDKGKIREVDAKEIAELAIKVEARMEGGKPIYVVEDKPVEERNLVAALRQYVRQTQKTKVILYIDDNVPWQFDAKIRDAAKGAGISEVLEPVNKPMG